MINDGLIQIILFLILKKLVKKIWQKIWIYYIFSFDKSSDFFNQLHVYLLVSEKPTNPTYHLRGLKINYQFQGCYITYKNVHGCRIFTFELNSTNTPAMRQNAMCLTI